MKLHINAVLRAIDNRLSVFQKDGEGTRLTRLDTQEQDNLELIFQRHYKNHQESHRRNNLQTFVEEENLFIRDYQDRLLARHRDGKQKEAYWSLQDWSEYLSSLAENAGKPQGQRRTRSYDRYSASAAEVGILCRIVREKKIIIQGDLSNAKFCELVCNQLGLTYREKVRQSINTSMTPNIEAGFRRNIIPILPSDWLTTILEEFPQQ
ncbi:MAG: hypothetical protein ACON34_05330 [Flavobacteriales bacterium]